MIRSLLCLLGLLLLVPACAPREAEDKTESPEVQAAPAAAAEEGPALPAAATAEEAIETFFQGRKDGNLALARSVIPPGARFSLSGPAGLASYTVRSSRVLDADQAVLESVEGPKREAGDAIFDVREDYTDGRIINVSYYVRNFDGQWRIYGWGFRMDE